VQDKGRMGMGDQDQVPLTVVMIDCPVDMAPVMDLVEGEAEVVLETCHGVKWIMGRRISKHNTRQRPLAGNCALTSPQDMCILWP
jgi:hypothetical protein